MKEDKQIITVADLIAKLQMLDENLKCYIDYDGMQHQIKELDIENDQVTLCHF